MNGADGLGANEAVEKLAAVAKLAIAIRLIIAGFYMKIQ